MEKYHHKKIELKWQKYWEKYPDLYQADDQSKAEKIYVLDMFPYPSGEGLHAGHVESYTATDIISRYLRMRGKNVLHPQGWDAFGLPAENYAIKTKIHPAITTKKAIKTFKEQMKMMGFSYDWSREITSADPDYYKWTQWFFLLLYKNGLAYKAKGKVNWCESCQTVLANEQAEGGVCERCGSTIAQKDLEQWYFKITDFIEQQETPQIPQTPFIKGANKGGAEAKNCPICKGGIGGLKTTSGLLGGLDKIDWPESTKAGQRNWIGKSEGAIIKFPISNFQFPNKLQNPNDQIYFKVFTTRLDTIFGCTFALIAPEHEFVQKLKPQITNWPEVEKYIIESKKKTELQRIAAVKEKTGVQLKGIKVINPFTKQEIPLFASDFVLAHYGTGAVMAVPGHDQRDYDFAKKFKLSIEEVIKSVKTSPQPFPYQGEGAFTEDGVLINSGQYDGLTSTEARRKMTEWLEKEKIGHGTVNYKIRDWLVSRQRYWGAPIPIIYCDKCKEKKYKYLLLHGRHGSSEGDFFPWLKKELESLGHQVYAPDLPNTKDPKVAEQADFVIKNYEINKGTIIVGHSLGGAVAMNILEKTNKKVAKVVFVDSLIYPKFNDKLRPDLERNFNWKFDFEKIKKLSGEFVDLADSNFPIITKEQFIEKRELLNTRLIYVRPNSNHFNSEIEPLILQYALMDGMHLVPEKDLPVKLPTDVDFMPHGESPLASSKKFQNVKCPVCGASARREADTMDTFVCSSWYYFRYPSTHSARSGQVAFDPELTRKWLPVDLYVGGAEHTVLHLLYSRFFTKVLHKLGYIDFDEPFVKLRHQGIILAEDGRKMSKSLGNVINPDSVVAEYGADALRMFEMFMGPLEDAKSWNTKGIVGISRFLEKVVKLKSRIKRELKANELESNNRELEQLLHKTIKKVGEDIEALKFNTAISALMIFINETEKEQKISINIFEKFLIILSPFAPHLAEELWSQLTPLTKGAGGFQSIFKEKWPEYDKNLIKDETINLVVQVNNKVRDMIEVSADISEEEAKKIAMETEKIKKWLEGKEVIKTIFVKGKLVNIVIK